jgi:muramoyltetrapeptide carboxypeptidase LdcA involved in peptidoglycan recycling
MSAITPLFNGSYSNGRLINNITNYTIGDNFKYYVESMEIVYDNIHDRKLTGFSDTKYLQNAVNAQYCSGSIAITLVGDLPHWLMQQLLQLAKAILGGGMDLTFSDTFATYDTYICKWENAGDFVENNAVLAGGTLALRFYSRVD